MMKRKTISLLRITAICLVILSMLIFCVSAISTSSVKREYESVRNSFAESADKISKNIKNNENKIKKNSEELNKIKSEVDSQKSLADELNKQVGELSNYTDGKVCYLTFDDGPSEHTKQILKILKDHHAKATFFVTGVGSTRYMKDIVDSGNAIALHTYCHDYSSIYKSTDAYFNDLKRIHDLVQKETGVDSRVIRFPGGSSNLVSQNYCDGIMTKLTREVEERGYAYFDWNVDSTDASGNNVPVDILVRNAVDYATMSRINILMHDTDAKKTTVKALPKIIDELNKKGYTFEVLTEDTTGFHHAVNN